MRFRQFKTRLLEAVSTTISADHLEGFKDIIANRIKQLPDDDVTIKALKEIEEMLSHLGAGGRLGMIGKEIDQIQDDAVTDAKKILSRFILSIDSTPEERQEFFALWKGDKIVNIPVLLSGNDVGFSDVFAAYGKNNLATEFIDEVMMISELGIGKGEFGLNVLSKSIATSGKSVKEEEKEQATGEGAKKGDLVIKLGGKILHVECKTEQGGAARFSDQEVKPAEGYEAIARKTIDFVAKNKTYPMQVPGYGLNLSSAIQFYQNVGTADRNKFLTLIRSCLEHIFDTSGNVKPKQKAAIKQNINSLLAAVQVGNEGAAKQQYGQATFNYYIGKKEDDGVLNTNLNTKRFIYYNDAASLQSQGLRLQIKTAYIASTKDIARSVYPQVAIVPTTFGGNVAQAGLKQLSKGKTPLQATDFNSKLADWAMQLASSRGVTNKNIISGMATNTMKMIQQKIPSDQIIAALEKMYPQLAPKITPKPVAQPAPPAQQPI